MNIVILGLSITSSWGNGHATTYRALVRALDEQGHRVLFLERDVPWYAAHRDLPQPPFCRTALYGSIDDLRRAHRDAVAEADLVIVGSYVPEGVAVGEWVIDTAQGVRAFYDIDTPVTLARLAAGDREYLAPSLIPRYDLYLSFTGGPTLDLIEREYGSPCARPLYCAVDPSLYFPEPHPTRWDLGYMGTYSPDRQPPLERLMLGAARAWTDGRFVVAGPQYPEDTRWPTNVERVEHLAPSGHRAFYASQRFTLSITREQMVRAGWSPSVRLFEAAACGIPVITDEWPGLADFFEPGREILIARDAADTLACLRDLPEAERQAIGTRALERVLREHTAARRAEHLVATVASLRRLEAAR